MSLKLKKHADKILIAICYYEHYVKHHPKEEGLFTINMGGDSKEEILNALESIKILKTLLGAIVEIPYTKFSRPIGKFEYLKSCYLSLRQIENDYLSLAELSEEEKKNVLKVIREFYLQNEYRILLTYRSYDATPQDRIAHHVMMIGLSMALWPLFKLLAKAVHAFKGNSDKDEEEQEVFDFDTLYDEYISDPELNDPIISKTKVVTGTILKIYNEMDSRLSALTEYQKQTITGYIAVRFGLIDFNQRPKPGSYTTDNNYLAERVRTIVNRAPVQK